MKGTWRRGLLLGAIASLAVCGSAGAQTTIGALPRTTPIGNCTGPRDITQLTDTSATYTVPVDGVITSWSTFAATVEDQRSTFKVVRSIESRMQVRAHDAPRALVPGQVNTFRTSIPVQQGDVLALNGGPGLSACQFNTGIAGDETLFTERDVDTPDFQSFDRAFGDDGFLVNVQATILPPPRLTAISPNRGSIAGGTPVTVSGANLAEVQSVSFSGVPALSYSVANEGQLTAVAPPNAELTCARSKSRRSPAAPAPRRPSTTSVAPSRS